MRCHVCRCSYRGNGNIISAPPADDTPKPQKAQLKGPRSNGDIIAQTVSRAFHNAEEIVPLSIAGSYRHRCHRTAMDDYTAPCVER